jgi:protein transport protein SEC24
MTSNLFKVYSSVDQIAVVTYLANKFVEYALSSELKDTQDAITNKVSDILTAYKTSLTGGGGGGQLATADNMKLLPVLALGLLKHVSSVQLIFWMVGYADWWSFGWV